MIILTLLAAGVVVGILVMVASSPAAAPAQTAVDDLPLGAPFLPEMPDLETVADRVSLPAAAEQLAFTIPTLPGLASEEIWVVNPGWDIQDRGLLIRYAGGTELRMRPDPVKPDWEGIRVDTPQLQAVKVRKVDGVGVDPGYTVFSGKKYPYDGVLGWWEDGIDFRLTGKTMSLAELLTLAEKMAW